jgi:hypothetical protein
VLNITIPCNQNITLFMSFMSRGHIFIFEIHSSALKVQLQKETQVEVIKAEQQVPIFSGMSQTEREKKRERERERERKRESGRE